MPPANYDDPLVQALIGEAASEGETGMRLVLDTIYNRSQRRGKSLEQIVQQPYQFSAMQRPDLARFVQSQPQDVLLLALRLAAQARQPDYQPTYPTDHYVTSEFYKNRGQLKPDHWLHQMEPAQTVGGHVALQPRKR